MAGTNHNRQVNNSIERKKDDVCARQDDQAQHGSTGSHYHVMQAQQVTQLKQQDMILSSYNAEKLTHPCMSTPRTD